MRLSVKLGVLCAAAAVAPLVIASIAVVPRLPSRKPDYPIERLQSNARTALSLYEKRLEQMRLAAQHLANEMSIKILGGASSESETTRLARTQDLLTRARDELALDFLIVTDKTGQVIARHNDRPAPGESLLAPNKNLMVDSVISGIRDSHTSPLAGCIVETGDQLRKLWVDNATIDREDGSSLTEGLVIEAAAPIFSGSGFQGTILIGQMLNKYNVGRTGAKNPLVAEVRQTLFGGSDREGGALIALGDTIIASSVRDASTKTLLVGLRRDASVQEGEETLSNGSHKYLVYWQPLRSSGGSTVGSLGACVLLVEPGWAAANAIKLAAMIAVGAVLLLGLSGLLVGRALASRINSLSEAVGRMSVGELSTTVKDISANGSRPADEIGRLADQLEQMRESFRQAIERLRKR